MAPLCSTATRPSGEFERLTKAEMVAWEPSAESRAWFRSVAISFQSKGITLADCAWARSRNVLAILRSRSRSRCAMARSGGWVPSWARTFPARARQYRGGLHVAVLDVGENGVGAAQGTRHQVFHRVPDNQDGLFLSSVRVRGGADFAALSATRSRNGAEYTSNFFTTERHVRCRSVRIAIARTVIRVASSWFSSATAGF